MKISLLPAGTTPTGVEVIPAVQGGQTVSLTATQIAGAVADDVITNAKAANMAQSTIKGRAAAAGTGDPTDLTAAQVKTILGLATTSTDKAIARFSGTSGNTQNSGVTLDDNDQINGVSEWITKGVTATPSDAGGSTLSVNLHRVTSDNVDAGAGFIIGHQRRYVFGGSAVKGGRIAGYDFVANTVASNSANTNRNYVANVGVAYTAVGDGGSDTSSNAKGAYFGGNPSAHLDTGATNVFEACGAEFDVTISAGASTRYARGISIVGFHAVRGADIDCGLSISGGTGHVGYKHGILFTDANRATTETPFYASSVLLGSYWIGSAPTIDKGIDLTGFTCTNGAFISTNFKVGQNGGLTLNNTNANIEIGSTSGANTPFIDWHSSGNAIDYDVRISASGGTGSVGNGVLAIEASSLTTTSPWTALSGTAIPAGGTAGSGYKFSSTSNFGIFFGSGAPSLAAAKGSLYLRSDGSSTSTRMYVNTDGSTTWTNVTTAA